MHLTTLAAFVALEVVLCFIPGPAVMAVVGATLLGRSRSGFATAGGILTGNTVYFIISALGVASVIAASHTAFTVIKLCGAAYLAYLGIRAILAKEKDVPAELSPQTRAARGWANGTVVQLSNPKALIFFTAILPQFIDPRGNVLVQIVILGFAGLAVELGVLSVYVLAANRLTGNGMAARRHVWAQRVGGAFLLGVAAAVARES
ncbi:MAG: LysE family translocator [Candidatus Eremiobacteraeota bacterium]|nr:LysE family translocator [Candidatus Eremiobacteraeota bacterium]